MSILTKKKKNVKNNAKTSSIPRNKKNKNKTRTRKNIGKSRKKLRSKDIDERAEPYISEGKYTIWHFALEHVDEKMNYGVYVNGGLHVETCSIRTLKNKSNMLII